MTEVPAVGIIPASPLPKPKKPADPTISNMLFGLNMFLPLLVTQGSFQMGSSTFWLTEFDMDYGEAVLKSLNKKGWRQHPLGGAMYTGTL